MVHLEGALDCGEEDLQRRPWQGREGQKALNDAQGVVCPFMALERSRPKA